MKYYWHIFVILILPLVAWGQQNSIEKTLVEFVAAPQRDPHSEENGLGRLLSSGKKFQLEWKEIITGENRDDIRSWAVHLPARMPRNEAQVLVPQLIVALRDHSWKVRKNAANTLGIIHATNAEEALLQCLEDPHVFVRDSVEYALQKLLDEGDMEDLDAAFAEMNADARSRIVTLAGEFHTRRAIPLLQKALRDEDADVRAKAVYYLSHIEDEKSTHIFSLAEDPSPKVRCQVATALSRWNSPRKKKFLLPLLRDPDNRVKLRAIESIEDVELLCRFIEKGTIDERVTAAMALLQMGKARVPTVRKLLNQEELSEYLKAKLLYGLGSLGTHEAAAELCRHLADPSQLVKNLSISALLHIAASHRISPPMTVEETDSWKRWLQQHSSQLAAAPVVSGNAKNTLHYRIETDLNAAFLQQIVVMMESLNIRYREIFSQRPRWERMSEAEIGELSRVVKRDGSYEFPSGVRVTFDSESSARRTIHYPSGKVVVLTPGVIKKVTTPEGKKVTKQDATAPISKRITLRIFKKRRNFREYARKKDGQWPFLQDSGAYYSLSRSEIITYAKSDRKFLQSTLFHETLHQVLIQYLFDCPIWLNEGLAEYFSNFRWTKKGYRVGLLDRKYLPFLQQILRQQQYIPLENLIRLDHFSFHNDNFGPEETMHYVQSWALVYFLHHYQNGRYADLLQQYYFCLKDEEHPVSSFERLLEQRDLTVATLEKQWKEYFLNLGSQSDDRSQQSE